MALSMKFPRNQKHNILFLVVKAHSAFTKRKRIQTMELPAALKLYCPLHPVLFFIFFLDLCKTRKCRQMYSKAHTHTYTHSIFSLLYYCHTNSDFFLPEIWQVFPTNIKIMVEVLAHEQKHKYL